MKDQQYQVFAPASPLLEILRHSDTLYIILRKRKIQTVIISSEENASLLETERFEINTCDENCGVFVKDKRTGKHVSIVPEVYEDAGDVWSFNTCGFGDKLESFKAEDSFCTERGNIISTVRTRSAFRDLHLNSI